MGTPDFIWKVRNPLNNPLLPKQWAEVLGNQYVVGQFDEAIRLIDPRLKI